MPTLQAARFVVTLLVARVLGYRVVWTLHELYRQASVSRRVERAVSRRLGRLADVVFVHDAEAATRASAELGVPDERLRIVAHPSFSGVYRPGVGRPTSRRRLGLREEQFVFLYFGSLRSDKQPGLLLDAFSSLTDARLALIIAGGVRDQDCAQACEAAARRDPRIKLHLYEVGDASVSDLFAAADAFVSPRADGWTSGSLILALSMGVPVVAANCPTYAELIGHGSAGWMFDGNDPDSLAAALAAAAEDAAEASAKARAARQLAQSLPQWSELALQTAHAMSSFVDSRDEQARRRPSPSGEIASRRRAPTSRGEVSSSPAGQ